MAVSERVLEIFKFIDFLYLNINEFNKYNVLINECITLRDKKDSIDVSSNYKLKLEYDTIYKELSSKNKIFVKFRVQPILSLAVELRIIDRDDRGGSTIETNCYRYLRDLKDDFEVKDVDVIKEYRRKYLKFRKEVSCKNVLCEFFQELDKCFIPFFEFFKEVDDENQFDEFETKYKEVDCLEQFCANIKLGNKVKMTLPFNSFSNLQTDEKEIIETEIISPEIDLISMQNKETYTYVFKRNGFEIFDYIMNNTINKGRGKYADISFYYRMLVEDDYIHVKSTPFKDWFNNTYDETLDKIKTINEVKSDIRIKEYSRVLEVFK